MQTKLQDYMLKKLQVNKTECLVVILLLSLHDLLLTNFLAVFIHVCIHVSFYVCIHVFIHVLNFLYHIILSQ